MGWLATLCRLFAQDSMEGMDKDFILVDIAFFNTDMSSTAFAV